MVARQGRTRFGSEMKEVGSGRPGPPPAPAAAAGQRDGPRRSGPAGIGPGGLAGRGRTGRDRDGGDRGTRSDQVRSPRARNVRRSSRVPGRASREDRGTRIRSDSVASSHGAGNASELRPCSTAKRAASLFDGPNELHPCSTPQTSCVPVRRLFDGQIGMFPCGARSDGSLDQVHGVVQSRPRHGERGGLVVRRVEQLHVAVHLRPRERTH